ncbi:hypothetical protein [uncultured Bacteroides sp.]|uniref:hypothetical protein n=1 Tax=uncultured Bacteroides sp. TaxID=162156 RepID=UPI00259908E8|nr:hypothetical protein [uncultured Bacteroides sp.]
MHPFCSGAATMFAVALQLYLQWRCNCYAVALQPLCSSDAAVSYGIGGRQLTVLEPSPPTFFRTKASRQTERKK